MSKKSRSHEYSSNSSGSDSDEEVVWKESKSKNETNEWLDLFENKCTKNVKSNKKLEDKREKEINDLKIRQQRELNPYIRYDKDGNHIIDEPRALRRPEPQPQASGSSTSSLSERNAINAKIMKAELMGNKKLVNDLKEKLKQLESNQSESQRDLAEEQTDYYSLQTKHNEESMSLKELYYREKQSTAEDENRRFVATSSKIRTKYPEEEYEDTRKKKRKHESDPRARYVKQEDRDRQKCRQCLESIDKHLILKTGEKTFVSLTPFEPFVKGMCHILSRSHSDMSFVSCDEECLQEINNLKHQISKFFSKQKRSVIFMETYFKKRYSNSHLLIECIPIKSKYESDAKIFFKKAIMECEGEWAMNKKVIEIRDKPVNRMIPKGLSYFWVTIGPQNNGFGHVIESEDSFPDYFGKEVIGGLLDIEPNKWHKPKHQNYDQQFERAVNLKKDWNKMFS